MESRSPIDYIAFDDDPRVFCYRDLVRLFDNVNAALLMSQLVYWFRSPPDHPSDGRQLPRARAIVDGQIWVDKSHADLSLETGLSQSKVKRALAYLRTQDCVETRRHVYNGNRTSLRQLTTTFRESNATGLCETGVTVYATTVGMTGSTSEALVLSQFCYWSSTNAAGRCRLRVFRNGEYWIAKSHKELAAETGLRSRSTRCAVDRLVDRGLLVKDHFVFGGRRMLHLRVDQDQFGDAWVRQKEHELSLGR